MQVRIRAAWRGVDLKAERIRSRLRAEEIAHELGLDERTVRRYERREEISESLLHRYLNALEAAEAKRAK